MEQGLWKNPSYFFEMKNKNKKYIWKGFVLLILFFIFNHLTYIQTNLQTILQVKEDSYLLVYALCFLGTLILYQHRKKTYDPGSVLYSIYTISAFGSCWYYSLDKVSTFYPNVTLPPLLFLFATINICMIPLWTFDFSQVRGINSNGIDNLLKIISIVFIVCSIFPMITLLSHLSADSLTGSFLSSMYSSKDDTAELLFHGPVKISFAIIRRFEILATILFFYQWTQRNKILTLGLSITLTMFIIFKLMSGSRGGLVGSMLSIIMTYLFLRSSIQKDIQKKINTIGMVAATIFILAMAAISISRFNEKSSKDSNFTIDMWVSQYVGESTIRFSNSIWETKTFMDGKQNFMLVKKAIGNDYIENYEKYKDYGHARMRAPVDVFYTFIGDMFIDFGFRGTWMFIILFFLIFKRLLKKQKNKIPILPLVFILVLLNYLSFGFAANVYRIMYIQENLMWLFVAAIMIHFAQYSALKNETK